MRMRNKYASLILVVFTVLSLLPLFPTASSGSREVDCTASRSRGRTIVVNASGGGNYTHIQLAIDNASDGDTVNVEAGTYYENIIINKKIKLVGAGINKTTIDGRGKNDVILITASDVMVCHFGITNSGNNYNEGGIHIINTEMCRIDKNYIFNNSIGIFFSNSNDSFIINNTCIYNRNDDIRVYGSSNTITNNTCKSNRANGIRSGGSHNIITNNLCCYSRDIGIDVSGNENTISNNICNVNSNFGIKVGGSQNNITNNTCDRNYFGINIDRNDRTTVTSTPSQK